MIILNTRPTVHRTSFTAAFKPLGLQILHSPLLDAERLPAWPQDPTEYDALIFTSAVAPALRPADARWNNLPAFAVGPATAAAARAAGFVDVRRTGFTAADLSAELARQSFRRALYLSGEDVTVDLAASFPGRIERAVVYRMSPQPALSIHAQAALRSGLPVYAPLFSRRSAEVFAALVEAKPAHLTAVGISAAVLDISSPPWSARIIASTPTSEAMADALAVHLNTQRKAA